MRGHSEAPDQKGAKNLESQSQYISAFHGERAFLYTKYGEAVREQRWFRNIKGRNPASDDPIAPTVGGRCIWSQD